MPTFQVTDQAAAYLGDALVDFNSHVFKAALCLTAPTKAGTTNLASVTQIAATGGYAPVTLTSVTYAETGGGTGIWQFSSAAFEWVASGANFASAQYMVIYDDNGAGKEVLGFLDYGAPFTVQDAQTLRYTPGANGIFRITVS